MIIPNGWWCDIMMGLLAVVFCAREWTLSPGPGLMNEVARQ